MVVFAHAHPIVSASARGRVLKSENALSFWGGVDPYTGIIIDQRHDRCGECVAGRILLLPSEKGSSTGSAVLLELIRIQRAPAAILTQHLTPILALGAIIADELYGTTLPILTISVEDFARLNENMALSISSNGVIHDPSET